MEDDSKANIIFNRYKKTCMIMRIFKYLCAITAILITCMTFTSINIFNFIWSLAFDVFVLLLIYILRYIRVILVLRFNKIINTDCDPYTFVEVYQLLEKEDKKNKGHITTTVNIAKGLYYQGKFNESFELISSITPNYKNTFLLLQYYSGLLSCSIALKKDYEFTSLNEKIKKLTDEQKPNSAFKKMGIQLLKNIELSYLEEGNDFSQYSKIIDDSLQNSKTNLEKIVFHYRKAKLSMKMLKYDYAKENCTYIIENGNKLFYVNETNEILKSITILQRKDERTSMIMNYGVFPIEDVFIIKGCGVVAAGKVTDGTFRVGDEIIIMRQDGSEIKSTIKGLEVFGHMESAQKGDNVGLLLSDIAINDISKGDIIRKQSVLN